MVSSAVLPTNGTFLGAQTKELGLEKLRAVIPVCSSCRISPGPAGLGGQVLSLILVMRWAEPALLPGSGRAGGSSLLSKISSSTTPCLGERADPCESGGGNLEAFQAACGFPVLDFGHFHFQLSTLFPREAQHNPCRNSGSIYRQLAGHLRSATNNFLFKQRLLVIHSFLS